nr:DUF3006 domain-containing protein [Oscillochloris trichoides]
MNDQPVYQSAVIDRYEGRLAVLLVGPQQEQYDVPRKQLPRHARPGTWLRIVLNGAEVVVAEIDAEATAAAQARIAEKLARLRRGEHQG